MRCNSANLAILLGVVDDVRTCQSGKKRRVLKRAREICAYLQTDEGRDILDNIRRITAVCEPEAVAK